MKKILLWLQVLLLIIVLFGLSYGTNTYVVYNQSRVVFESDRRINFDRSVQRESLKDINAIYYTPVTYEEIPKFCINAVVATEDKSFWNNPGLDRNGVLRFFLTAISLGRYKAGGSSITQQVVKLSNESIYNRTPFTKYKEALQALKLDKMYSKQEIITMYLNNVYLGHWNNGVETAAWDYFKKSTRELTDAQCSYIAGLPQRPSIYNPYENLNLGLERQRTVLESMVKAGYISEEYKDKILKEDLDFRLDKL